MAFAPLTTQARAVVVAATREEAGTAGRGVIEAEHLLLALASHPGLRALGLDRDELVSALTREEAHSLAAIGVVADHFRAPATVRKPDTHRMATSAKLALRRAAWIAGRRGERRIGPRHLLLGVLAAERGRVPRALELAGIDFRAMTERLES